MGDLRYRLVREWPRIVIGAVSLYGIYFAFTAIAASQTEIAEMDTPGAVRVLAEKYGGRPLKSMRMMALAMTSGDSGEPAVGKTQRANDAYNSSAASGLDKGSDLTSHAAAAAVYVLLVISSLSIIDNAIGIMVVTRKSLKLTQVAFVIWCLRFIYKVLSLVAVVYMLVVNIQLARSKAPLVPQREQPVVVQNGDGDGSGIGPAFDLIGVVRGASDPDDVNGGVLMVTLLEVTVAILHGWSLLVLIRELRSQPRTPSGRLWWRRGRASENLQGEFSPASSLRSRNSSTISLHGVGDWGTDWGSQRSRSPSMSSLLTISSAGVGVGTAGSIDVDTSSIWSKEKM